MIDDGNFVMHKLNYCVEHKNTISAPVNNRIPNKSSKWAISKKARLLRTAYKVQIYLLTYLLKIVYSEKNWKNSQEKTTTLESFFGEAAVKQHKMLHKSDSRQDVYQWNFLIIFRKKQNHILNISEQLPLKV